MCAQEQAKSAAADAQSTTESGLLDAIVSKGMRARDDDSKKRAKDLIGNFVSELMSPGMVVAKDTEKTINLRIAAIDQLLSAQLNQIMHHEDFQKLEGSWRGLHYLVHQTETGTQLKLRVLNVSKKDLLNDLERASEFDQSALFKKVYEDEYGMAGGHPIGALIGDYEFGKHPQDMALLERISNVAAAAHAPFLSAADPSLFGFDSFTELSRPRDLAKIFEQTEYVKWRAFRDSEDSRYVGLTLPHTLARLPYGAETVPVEAFNFEEDTDGKDHSKYLWSNAAYALGTRLTDSFAQCGWLATIRGVQGGGCVQGLPTHTFPTDDGEIALKCPTEIAITDRREKELSDLGFIPLCHFKNTDYAVFFGTQSCQKPKVYDRDDANANARLSTMLQYILCTSRFAHFLKVMARDQIGSFMERDECEQWLNRWINNYCVADPSLVGPEIKAQRPLRDAKITVREVKGKPGCYEAVAHLRPHFQLEELGVSLRLVAELPEAKG